MKKLTWDEARRHLPETIGPDLYTYATDHMFAGRHYFFVWSENGRPAGYCTRCHKTAYLIGTPQHNSMEVCPHCLFDVIVKHKRYKHSKLVDFAYFVWYDKAPVDDSIVVARGFLAKRDLRYSFQKAKTQLAQETFYIFRPGMGGQLFFDRGYPNRLGDAFLPNSTQHPASAAKVYSRINIYDHRGWVYDTGCEATSVARAIQGTPLQYVPYEEYWITSPDLVKLFDLACRYPSVEYLTKLGCSRIVEERLIHDSTNGAINWAGKTPAAVLKVPKEEAKETISKISNGMTSFDLALHQLVRKKQMGLTSEHIKMALEYGPWRLSKIAKKLDDPTYVADIKYLCRQSKGYRSEYTLIHDFQDYLNQCAQLEMDAQDISIRYPTNLDRAHTNLAQRIKFKASAVITEGIVKQLPELRKRYSFESERFFIRPVESSSELIHEGNALHHCVGSYAERYSQGHITILVLRSKKRPNKALYTIEVREDRVQQCRGFKNRAPSKEVAAFLADFKMHIKKKPKRRKQAS